MRFEAAPVFPEYHAAIVDAQFERLKERAAAEGWRNLAVERDDSQIYVRLAVERPAPYRYISRIDISRYPVDPYWIGFINPDLPQERWREASDSDPRFWPWSPMPGLHGSFILAFQGPFRTFWCRDCNLPFFHYHGDQRWVPAAWPLDRLVAHLRQAVDLAEPPNRWRPLQQSILLMEAAKVGATLPEGAGLGAR